MSDESDAEVEKLCEIARDLAEALHETTTGHLDRAIGILTLAIRIIHIGAENRGRDMIEEVVADCLAQLYVQRAEGPGKPGGRYRVTIDRRPR